jgi:hypothetical protein
VVIPDVGFERPCYPPPRLFALLLVRAWSESHTRLSFQLPGLARNPRPAPTVGPALWQPFRLVRVDTGRQIAYVTNSNEDALIVVDLKSGKTREPGGIEFSTCP